MNKSTYIFICLILSVGFWQLSFLQEFLTQDVVLLLTWLWAFSAFVFFSSKSRTVSIYSSKYINYTYYIFAGVLISMFSAYFSWGQSFLRTLITQRYIYSFILLPAILYIQPNESDIIKALKWISIGTILVWFINAFNPTFVSVDEDSIQLEKNHELDIGSYVSGIYFVVLFLYYKIQEYLNKFSWNSFMKVAILLIFLILYQNRSILIGVTPVFIYSLLKFKSKYKIFLIFLLSTILIGGIIYSWSFWESLVSQTQNQLNDTEYPRWIALNYYFNDYSPNWFCLIFGNGMPSIGNSDFGDLMKDNMENGIYASDLGMIGMWTTYGLIPLITIYSLIIRILHRREFPLYLKFISFHILIVPTIFHFWTNPGIFMFVLIMYLYSYYTEQNKLLPDRVNERSAKVYFTKIIVSDPDVPDVKPHFE